MATTESREGDSSLIGLVFEFIATAKNTLLAPYRVLTSKFALRAYLTSILFTLTAITLLGFAIAAYVLFYWSYIPRIGFTRPIHLQFDPLPAECVSLGNTSPSNSPIPQCAPTHPWGTASLTPDLVSQQRYDITIHLSLPRTLSNTLLGNFMLDARLYSPRDPSTSSSDALKTSLDFASSSDDSESSERLLAHARRPAIMTYYSRPVAFAQTIAQLHWYLVGWRREAESLSIPLFEGLEFEKGWRNVASKMRIEVQTADRRQMQVYDARVEFTARFAGLRWVMYNWRVSSAVVFIGLFWGMEVLGMAVAWGVLSWIVFGGGDDGSDVQEERRGRLRIKAEDQNGSSDVRVKEEEKERDMSDTERSFPTYGSQPPLRYIKKEDGTTPLTAEMLAQVPAGGLAVDADDEDEDADFILDEGSMQWRDSGLGTSMESSGPNKAAAVRRRRSRTSG